MTRPVEVYVDPPTHHFLEDRLFEDDGGRLNGDAQNAPYVHLRERFAALGVRVRTADYLPPSPDPATLKLYFSLGRTESAARLAAREDVVASAFFALECPIVEPSMYAALPRLARHFRRLYSWTDAAALRRFTGGDLALERFRWPQSFDAVHEDEWHRRDRRFLVMINANKLPRIYWNELYTERMRAVAFFDRTGEIDLYGKGWDQPSIRVGKTWMPWTIKLPLLALRNRWRKVFPDPLLAAAQRAWRGPAPSKRATLAQYRFALCFENCVLDGWITEKLFDCFYSGTVPVYWGAPDIESAVPAECYVDMRRFAGYPELREYLHGLSPAEVDRYREAAREFLRSPAYEPFSRAAFTRIFERCLREDTGAPAAAAAA